MSKLYLGDDLIASLEASDIKYNSSTTVKSKIDTLNTNITNLSSNLDTKIDSVNTSIKNTKSELNSKIESKFFQYRLQMTSDLTIKSSSETIIPFSSYWNSDASFRLNSDGTITYLGENPAYIMISASLYFYTGTTNAMKQIRIYRNSTVVCTGNIYAAANYISLIAPTSVHNLKNGDIIKVCYIGVDKDKIGSNSNISQLSLIGYTSEYLADK